LESDLNLAKTGANVTQDTQETDKVGRTGADGTIDAIFPMNSNDLVLVKLMRNQAAK
jgi:hypothetical protein